MDEIIIYRAIEIWYIINASILSDSKYIPYYYETTVENTVNQEEYDIELNQEEHNNSNRVRQSIENDTLSKDENENVDIIKDNKLNENESGKISTVIAPTKNQKEVEQQSSDYWRDMKEKLVIIWNMLVDIVHCVYCWSLMNYQIL